MYTRLFLPGVIAAAFAVLAPSAIAAYGEVGSFSGSGSGDGELNSPRDAALEYSTGNLIVVDRGSDRIQVFDPDGDSATYLTQFSSGLDDPTGIAIGESGGETVVYVSSAATNQIVKFSSDEQAVPSFTVDATFTSPAQGAAPGELASFDVPLAVDPTTGDLLVADRGNNRVNRYAADGTFDSSFDGSSSPTAFTGLVDIAADSTGDILVVDSSGDIYSDGTGTSSRVERFDSAGGYELTLGPVDGAGSVTTDPDDDRVFVGGKFHTWTSSATPRVYVFEADGAAVQEFDVNALYAVMPGLAAEDGGSNRLFVVTRDPFDSGFGPTGVRVVRDATPPTAAIGAPTDVTTSEATFNGTVNPLGFATEWHFEYRRVGADSWASTPVEDAGAGTEDVVVSATVDGLMPAAAYEVRLVAGSSDGTTTSPAVEFSAAAAPPAVEAADRATTRATAAIVYGVVTPYGLPTKYHFEFGESTGYGRRSPENRGVSAGDGSEPVTAMRTLSGLEPGTTYHYRLVAENDAGTTVGPDRTFTTLAQDPPRRPYEMVSPPDKNGAGVGVISAVAAGGVVSPSGDRIGFMSNNAFAGAQSAGTRNWYMASRGASSWATMSLAPPFRAVMVGGGDGPLMQGVSEDLTKTLFFTNLDPVTREVQPRRQGYVHDLVNGTYRLVTPDAVTGPQDYVPNRESITSVVRATTPDLAYVVIGTEAALTANAVGVPGQKLYRVDTATGEIVLVSVVDGEPTYWESGGGVLSGAGGPDTHGDNVTSADGSVVYFERAPMLYRRDVEAGETEAVNVPEGIVTPEQDATFLDASRSGRYVFFRTPQSLLPQDANPGSDIYRYDAEAPAGDRLELVTVDSEPADGIGAAGGSIAVSASGDRLYFGAESQLVAGGPTGAGVHLFAWDDGTLKYIATDTTERVTRYMINTYNRYRYSGTDSLGNYLYLTATEHFTAPEGAPSPEATQVYLYDVRASSPVAPDLVCASCLPAPAATPWGAGALTEMDSSWPVQRRRPYVTSDGAVLFATPTPLVPEDLNGPGQDYVYGEEKASAGQDVYLYRDGQLELISSGRHPRSSYPLGITPDGRTVAFGTAERLSGWDVDDAYDAYAARIDGGLPEPPVSKPACAGDECQGAGPTAPDLKTPANGSPGSGVKARLRASFTLSRIGAAQRRRIARSGRMGIVVRVDRAGRVGVTARARIGRRSVTVGRAAKRAARAGATRLSLRLSRPARRQLASEGRLRLSLSVSFSAAAEPKRSSLLLVKSASRKAADR